MKYGQALEERSVPQWAAYNVDYNELKHLIRVNTTKDQGQAIAIPGHGESALQKFEENFYAELFEQHDRVGLFVKSKADELERRLKDYQTKVNRLIAQPDFEHGGVLSVRRKEKFSKLESRIMRCGEDVRNLERFTNAQRTAFQKIIKKYKKWTGSPRVSARFTDEVLNSPTSFTQIDFEPLYSQYSRLIVHLRTSSPSQSGSTTPLSETRPESQRRMRQQPVIQIPERQAYWNEYDNGSEADDNDTYALYIDPDAESTFPGAKAAVKIYTALSSRAKVPMEKVRDWFSPNSSLKERRPLLTSNTFSPPGTDTDIESIGEFPSGYETYYATFPSISDQKLSRSRDKLLFRGTIGCFVAAFILLGVAAILVTTGRRKLRIEVDVGVTVGVVASLFFATFGLTICLYRWARATWIERGLVSISFLATCLASGALLVLVMGNIEP